MKIQENEYIKGTYEIINQDTRLFVGSLDNLRKLVDEIEAFLETENQRIMLENFKMKDLYASRQT